MDFWRYNTICFEDIPENEFLNVNLKESKAAHFSNMEIEYLIAWYHKTKMGSPFSITKPAILKYLELNCSNTNDFEGIEKCIGLKRLELHYCIKLLNDRGISSVADTLVHLHINQSKKFRITDEIMKLKNLRVLCLNSCGEIDDLSFLNAFPKLIDFRFVDTKVINGDLSPIVNHPTIRSAGYMNMRNYNINDIEMKRLLL